MASMQLCRESDYEANCYDSDRTQFKNVNSWDCESSEYDQQVYSKQSSLSVNHGSGQGWTQKMPDCKPSHQASFHGAGGQSKYGWSEKRVESFSHTEGNHGHKLAHQGSFKAAGGHTEQGWSEKRTEAFNHSDGNCAHKLGHQGSFKGAGAHSWSEKRTESFCLSDGTPAYKPAHHDFNHSANGHSGYGLTEKITECFGHKGGNHAHKGGHHGLSHSASGKACEFSEKEAEYGAYWNERKSGHKQNGMFIKKKKSREGRCSDGDDNSDSDNEGCPEASTP